MGFYKYYLSTTYSKLFIIYLESTKLQCNNMQLHSCIKYWKQQFSCTTYVLCISLYSTQYSATYVGIFNHYIDAFEKINIFAYSKRKVPIYRLDFREFWK